MSIIRGSVVLFAPGLLVLSLLALVPKTAPAASASAGTPRLVSSPAEVEVRLSPRPWAIILDGPAVLRQSPATIQASLGHPVRTKAVPPGDFRLPDGGIWWVYRGQGMRVDIDFERGRSTTVMIGFPDRVTAPTTYEGALEAVNIPSSARPDLVTRDSREWHNLQGYFVRVIAAYPALDSIDAIILSVHPFP